MIFLFQLGDVRIHLHGQRFQESEHTTEVKGVDYIGSMKKGWGDNRFTAKIQQQQLKGYLLSDCGMRADQVYQRLITLVGLPTHLIGYSDLDCCGFDCLCGAGSDMHVGWFETIGVLTSVSPTGIENRDEMEISITIEYQAVWTPLNRVFWEYGDWSRLLYLAPQETPYQYVNAAYAYPTPDMVFSSRVCQQFKRHAYLDPLIGYDPNYWVAVLDDLAPGYTDIGRAFTWQTNSGKTYQPFCDPANWSAPPSSVYAFRNLPHANGTEIVIDIERNARGVFERETERIKLDLFDMDNKLDAAGYLGLLDTDILYIGDLLYKPSMILRDGAFLEFRPTFSYEQDHPGFLMPGKNQVSIEVPFEAEFAAYHLWRRLS